MVRISDIFKKTAGNTGQHPSESKPKEEPVKEKPSEELKPKTPHFFPDTQPQKAVPQKEQSDSVPLRAPLENFKDTKGTFLTGRGTASPSEARGNQDAAISYEIVDKAHCKNSYLMGIQLIKEAFLDIENLKPVNLVQIEEWANEIVNCLISGGAELLNLFYGYTSENYLYDHMVNTAIMSIEVGLGLDYNKSQLNELCLAAFLHDIGMIKVGKLEMQPRRLSEEEYDRIKNHPLYGADILSKIKDIPDAVIYVVREQHERQDGSGYPHGLKNGKISEYARIVAIVDVYEALTHNRSYRKKISPHEAIKELIANDSLFDPLMLKVLVKKTGVYPISSWVELNSNEIGTVTMNNEGFPLRPVLQVLFDTKWNRLKNSRCIDLSKQFNLFIKKVITDEELAKEIKGPIEI